MQNFILNRKNYISTIIATFIYFSTVLSAQIIDPIGGETGIHHGTKILLT